MALIGLLPLAFSIFITGYEEYRTIRDTIGRDFQQIAIEAAGKIELQVTQITSEARQLATIPIVRSAVIDSNRSYAGRGATSIRKMIQEWERRWNARKDPDQFPDHINKMALDYLIDWIRIRKGEYISILVADNQGALVVSSSPRAAYDQSKSLWWQASYRGGRGQVYVSDLIFDQELGHYVIDVSAPILDDAQRKAVGVVNVRVRPDELFKAIQEVRLGEHGHAMLLNSAGRPLICPILSPERHTINADLMQQITQPRAGWVIAEDDAHGGHNSIVGFAPVRLQTPSGKRKPRGRRNSVDRVCAAGSIRDLCATQRTSQKGVGRRGGGVSPDAAGRAIFGASDRSSHSGTSRKGGADRPR